MSQGLKKKHRLASLLCGSRILDIAQLCRNTLIRSRSLTILAYHRVYNFDGLTYPFDDDLISASEEAFERQMLHVKKHFDIITFETLNQCIDTGLFPKNPLMITFDDGYRDNYINAFPVLKRHGIPATFFLSANHIGTEDIFGFEKVAYLIKKTKKTELYLESNRKYRFIIPPKDRLGLIAEVQALFKQVDRQTHQSLLTQMEKALEVDIYSGRMVEILTWDEVREMSRNGYEIGSHGASHINMTRTSDHELIEEIVGSKRSIEMETGKPVLAFAYPFGQEDSFDERVKQTIKKAGYSYAVSYIHGISSLTNHDPFELKRLHVESYLSMDYFKSMLVFPGIF